jgi:hypothetical protein
MPRRRSGAEPWSGFAFSDCPDSALTGLGAERIVRPLQNQETASDVSA